MSVAIGIARSRAVQDGNWHTLLRRHDPIDGPAADPAALFEYRQFVIGGRDKAMPYVEVRVALIRLNIENIGRTCNLAVPTIKGVAKIVECVAPCIVRVELQSTREPLHRRDLQAIIAGAVGIGAKTV